jgi:membrane associated rhomboid family serine protease
MAWRTTWDAPPRRTALFRGRPGLSGVKLLVLVNVAAFIVDWLVVVPSGHPMVPPVGILTRLGALRVTNAFLLYPFITYQFLHGGFFHLAINMLVLWMLGRHIEHHLGTRKFLYLYLLSGVVGGVFQVGFNVLMTRWYGPAVLSHATVGASGGVMGILAAFAILYPREEVYIFIFLFPVPVQARWLAIGYFALESFLAWEGIRSGMAGHVAHAAHIGGMVCAFVWMKFGPFLGELWREVRRGRAGGAAPGATGWGDPQADQAEVDRILQKIHDEGIGSLSTREKLFLQEMSRRFHD